MTGCNFNYETEYLNGSKTLKPDPSNCFSLDSNQPTTEWTSPAINKYCKKGLLGNLKKTVIYLI